jgi:hypothetical protein
MQGYPFLNKSHSSHITTERRMRVLRFRSFRRPHQWELHRHAQANPQDQVWSHQREHHHGQ